MDLRCWFCDYPAVTIAYGFAICAGREETQINHSERARHLFRVTVAELTPGARVPPPLDQT